MGGKRGRLSRRLSDADAIELFAKHHITQIRRRKNGEILQVKHVSVFGTHWSSPNEYVAWQHIHDILPQIIEGGYRSKSLLWGVSAELTILGSSVSLPLGMMFPLIETVALQDAIRAGNLPNIFYWGFALLGPFGDALAIKTIVDMIGGIPAGLADALGKFQQGAAATPYY
jgi:hypothetical protein